jgi:DNA topoisomerase-1
MRKAGKEADEIYLAPDPDREGEAIAWHIAHELKGLKKPMQRVEFHEITKKGVQLGLAKPAPGRREPLPGPAGPAHPRPAHRLRALARALEAPLPPGERALPLRGPRAVAALRLIVDREDEIIAFKPQEYWPVGVELLGGQKPSFPRRSSSPAAARWSRPPATARRSPAST